MNVPEQLGSGLATGAGVLQSVSGFDEVVTVFKGIQQGAGQFAQAIGNVSQQIFFFQFALQSIGQLAVSSPFKLLIGQQVELRQQLLETQSTLVATNRIIDRQSGQQINLPVTEGGSPGEAIVALTGATRSALAQLRKDSLDLVGVTSRELSEVFNITTTNLASTGIETNDILGDAADLTIKFSAALGTIGLPLFQARQEISSILQGTIDQNSVLAKTLNISNDQIQKYKEQGNLIEELNKRLEAFTAGNALAARSLSGVTSNLQEILEIVTLEAGAPLLDPILKDLNNLFRVLSSNQGALVNFLRPIIEDFERIREAISQVTVEIGQKLGPVLVGLPVGLLNALANLIVQVGQGISFTIDTLQPLINLLIPLVNIFTGLDNKFGKFIVTAFVFGKSLQLLSTSLKLFVNLVPGAGEAIFFLQNATKGAVAQFFNLRKGFGASKGVFSATSAAILTLGLNFEALQKAFPAINEGLTSSLGPFGAIVGKLVPQVSLFVGSLSRIAPVVNEIIKSVPLASTLLGAFGKQLSVGAGIIQNILSKQGITAYTNEIKDLQKALSGIASRSGQGFEVLIQSVDTLLTKVGQGVQTEGIKIPGLFQRIGTAAVEAAAKFGLLAIAFATAGIAISEFLQRRRTAGKEIRLLAQDIDTQIKALTDVGGLASGIDTKITKDFVDRFILLDRNFRFSELNFKNFGETVLSLGKSFAFLFGRILIFDAGIIKGISAAFSTLFEVVVRGVDLTLSSLNAFSKAIAQIATLDFKGVTQTFEDFTKRQVEGFTNSFERSKKQFQDAGGLLADAFGDGFGQFRTKGEKEIDDFNQEIARLVLPEKAKRLGQQISEVVAPNDAELKKRTDALAQNIAAIGKASQEPAERLAFFNQIVGRVNALEADDLISEDAAAEAKLALEDFERAFLSADGALRDLSDEGVKDYENAVAALQQTLSLGISVDRNVFLESQADQVRAQIRTIEEQIDSLLDKRNGLDEVRQQQTDATVEELRRAAIILKKQQEVLDELLKDTDVLPDAVTLLRNEIQRQEKDLNRFREQQALDTESRIAEISLDFLQRRVDGEVALTREKEGIIAQIRRDAVQEELVATNKAINAIAERRANLTDSQLEQAKELESQFIQLETRQAQLYDASLDLLRRNQEEATRFIEQSLLDVQNAIQSQNIALKDQAQEYERIGKLIDQQNAKLQAGQNFISTQAQAARQAQFQEAAAAVRLKALKQQLRFEQISFEFEQRKTELALERERVAAQIAQIEARAGLAQAQADLAKAEINPEATELDREAARISVQAAAAQVDGTRQNLALIDQQIRDQQTLRPLLERNLAAQQRAAEAQGERQFADAIATPGRRRTVQ